MKRYFLTALVGLAVVAVALAMPIKTKTCRLAGSSTPTGYMYYNVVDSTDTFEVDTLMSDSLS